MVRTKADAGLKVSAAKAPRKGLAPSSSGGSSGSQKSCSNNVKDKYSGGNSLNAQPTPEWQKGISTFFTKQEPDPEKAKKDVLNDNNSKMDTSDSSETEKDILNESSSKMETSESTNSKHSDAKESASAASSLKESDEKEMTASPEKSEGSGENKENSKKQFQSNGLISDDDE